MSIAGLRIAIIIVATFSTYSKSFAEESDFNAYMLRAVQVIKQSTNAKYGDAYFTKDLDYGDRKAVIKASRAPYTMCNAAVTEVILDAVNLYAADHKGWSPEDVVPASSWTSNEWSELKRHMFSHGYKDFPPFPALAKAKIPLQPALKDEIKAFDSERGIAFALEKFGLGKAVKFEEARPGDVIGFDRDLGSGGTGHAAIFLAFLTRDQKETLTYKDGAIVGFKYFSVQSSEPAGLGERWAYFKVTKDVGICPYSTDKPQPDPKVTKYCADAIDTVANRNRFPVLKAGQPRDCCVSRAPQLARVLIPTAWAYGDKRREIQKQEAKLLDDVEEFMENLSRASERLKLFAVGASQWEKQNPKSAGAAAAYIDKVHRKFNINLRTVAEAEASPEISRQELRQISRITPSYVIVKANETVTTRLQKEMDLRVRTAAAEKTHQLSAPTYDIPNPKLDGKTAD